MKMSGGVGGKSKNIKGEDTNKSRHPVEGDYTSHKPQGYTFLVALFLALEKIV